MQSRDVPLSVPFLLSQIIHNRHKDSPMLTTFEAQFLTSDNQIRTWLIRSQTYAQAILAAKGLSDLEDGTLIRVFKEFAW